MKNVVNIVRSVFFSLIQINYFGLFCYFGDEVTTGFAMIDNSIYQCCWEEFPLVAQKLMTTLIINSQKSIQIEGYMNTRCTREMFKNVILKMINNEKKKIQILSFKCFILQIINAAFSYFSMLRGFDR